MAMAVSSIGGAFLVALNDTLWVRQKYVVLCVTYYALCVMCYVLCIMYYVVCRESSQARKDPKNFRCPSPPHCSTRPTRCEFIAWELDNCLCGNRLHSKIFITKHYTPLFHNSCDIMEFVDTNILQVSG